MIVRYQKQKEDLEEQIATLETNSHNELQSVKHELDEKVQTLENQLKEAHDSVKKYQAEIKKLENDIKATNQDLAESRETEIVLRNKLEETKSNERDQKQFIEKTTETFTQRVSYKYALC